MDFQLSPEQRLLRDEIRRFARDQLNEDVARRDRDQAFRRDLWQAAAGMGLTGLPVGEQYGGSELDPLSTAVALEALGYGCEDSGLVFSICAHLLACVVPIWKFGTEEQKRKYLPGLCDGSLIAANGMTEPDSGSDAFAMRTRAVADGEEFILSGNKVLITNATVADLALIFAVTDAEKGYHGGITAFLVEAGTPGFQVGAKLEKMGLRTSPLGELALDGVRLPASSVLGGVGGGGTLFVDAMSWERACLFASHVGTMERLLEQAIRYSHSREQGGRSISKYQAISHKIAEMKIQLEAARLLTYKAAWNLERSSRVSLDAAIAKSFVSESLVRTALETVQVFGGYGYLTEYQVERALRDAVGSRLYSGTSEIQKNIIAGWLGL